MFRRIATSMAAALAILSLQAAPSHALAVKHIPKGAFLPSATTMPGGKATFSPLGHIEFCTSYPSECRGRTAGTKANKGIVELSAKTWGQLVRINAHMNAVIRPRSDRASHGKLDVWSIKGKYGDCEDYVIRKRSALIKVGWPSSSVLITTAKDHKGRPHAVLLARTSKGDFVLDNLNRKVRAWNKVSYRWNKRQSASNPQKWVSLSNKVTQPMPAIVNELKALKAKSANRQEWLMAALAKLREVRQKKLHATTLVKSQRNKTHSVPIPSAKEPRLAPVLTVLAKTWKFQGTGDAFNRCNADKSFTTLLMSRITPLQQAAASPRAGLRIPLLAVAGDTS